MPQVLTRTTVQTVLDYPPVCGQCRYFMPASERVTAWGSIIYRPSYCKLLAMADCDNTRTDHNDKVCSQYSEAIPF